MKNNIPQLTFQMEYHTSLHHCVLCMQLLCGKYHLGSVVVIPHSFSFLARRIFRGKYYDRLACLRINGPVQLVIYLGNAVI